MTLKLHNNGQNFSWSPTNCPLRFVKLEKTKWNGRYFFFMGNIAFFSEICVFSNLLGVAGTILQLAQGLSEYILDPYQKLRAASDIR